MNNEQTIRLREIVEEMSSLSDEAQDIIREHFPEEYAQAGAYQVWNTITSSNPSEILNCWRLMNIVIPFTFFILLPHLFWI